MKGTMLYEGNEEGIKVGRILMENLELGRPILRGLETCIEVFIRCGAYMRIVVMEVEIRIQGSMVVER